MLTRISVNVFNLSKTYSSCMTYLNSADILTIRFVSWTSRCTFYQHTERKKQIAHYNTANKSVFTTQHTNWIDDKSIPLFRYINNIFIWRMCVSNLHWSLLHQKVLYKGFTVTSVSHTSHGLVRKTDIPIRINILLDIVGCISLACKLVPIHCIPRESSHSYLIYRVHSPINM